MTVYIVRPILGLSSCLRGDEVRFDGAHKRDTWLVKTLSQYVDYHVVCPEVGIGLGIPRPPIRLVNVDGGTRVRGVADSSIDVTEQLQQFALDTLPQLKHLTGYVFKSKSPSCGVFRVKRYSTKGGMSENNGIGAYAEVICQHMPNLPIEEEGRLNDPVLRENFVNRIFVYHRWQQLLAQGVDAAGLLNFHAQHKYMLMAHSQAAYKRLGRLLSDLKNCDWPQLLKDYEQELMVALKRKVNRPKHVNVLQHIQGYLKKAISAEDKIELENNIQAYRRGEVPLIVPIKLLEHYFRCYPDEYIAAQAYLQPYPEALGLRNNI